METQQIILILSLASLSIAFQSQPIEKVHLQLRNTTVTENGEPVIKLGGECGGGKVLAFHLPQKGWFVCSAEPYPGYDFQKIARLEGNKISFNLANRSYEIISDKAINSGSQMMDLWVVQITPPSDKAHAESKMISCTSNFEYWLETTLFRKENR